MGFLIFFLPCWVGPGYRRTLCSVNITLSVVGFVCSKQQPTREDVGMESAAVALEMQERNQWCCGFYSTEGLHRSFSSSFFFFNNIHNPEGSNA